MRLEYTGNIRAKYLMNDLLAAFPAWRGTLQPNGRYRDPLLAMEYRGNTVWLNVPDDTDRAAVDAIVAAHDPRERRSALSDTRRAAWQTVKQAGETDPTWAALCVLLRQLRGERSAQ